MLLTEFTYIAIG